MKSPLLLSPWDLCAIFRRGSAGVLITEASNLRCGFSAGVEGSTTSPTARNSEHPMDNPDHIQGCSSADLGDKLYRRYICQHQHRKARHIMKSGARVCQYESMHEAIWALNRSCIKIKFRIITPTSRLQILHSFVVTLQFCGGKQDSTNETQNCCLNSRNCLSRSAPTAQSTSSRIVRHLISSQISHHIKMEHICVGFWS